MIEHTFEFCSLQYLNHWFMHDKNYCKKLSSDDKNEKLKVLKSAGAFYKVARNLPTEFEVKAKSRRYEPVLEIIDTLTQEQFIDNPCTKIKEIAGAISDKYGERNVLSLTTKFLWLKIKSPILIYDSQARIAVGANKNDIEDFYIKWHQEFNKYKTQIAQVCSKLSLLHLYVVDQNIGTAEYISKISSNPWFHERVFDIYLWNKGNS